MPKPRVEITAVNQSPVHTCYRVTCSACGIINHALKTERNAAESADLHENWHDVNRRIAQAENDQ